MLDSFDIEYGWHHTGWILHKKELTVDAAIKVANAKIKELKEQWEPGGIVRIVSIQKKVISILS